jgi:acetyltransferase-like isoleucine patch superfamily enzyme
LKRLYQRTKAILVFRYLNFLSSTSRLLCGKDNILIKGYSNVGLKYNVIGNGNYIDLLGVQGKNISIYVRGSNNKIVVKDGCQIRDTILWIEGNDCRIIIGEDTTIESGVLAAIDESTVLEIGRDCMLSTNISIRTGDSHPIYNIGSQERLNPSRNIFIGNHVWLGASATILKGVSVGDNAIVGAHSLVTRNVSESSLAAGVPAKEIRTRIYWKR